MQMTFRWYGKDDPVTLDQIRQIPGVTGVVTAIYDIPVGQTWSKERIGQLVKEVQEKGLDCKVIESVPVHEDIKMGRGKRDEYIQNYCQTLRNLGEAGVEVVCYNFMPVFDWTRSSLDWKNADGSTSLVYREGEVERMNPLSGDLALPGWDSSYTKDGLQALLETYQTITQEDLWGNLQYFLERVIPAAQEANVKMAIHPDDPPWDIFGLPRIITNEANLERFLKLVDSPYNGLTLCSGSLGADPGNDIPALIRKFGDRIHFGHCRNIRITGLRSFEETSHLSADGSLDMYQIMKAYHDIGFTGPIRPDHGRMIWGEQGRPGYGLYDRALGAAYLNGLWEAIDKEEQR